MTGPQGADGPTHHRSLNRRSALVPILIIAVTVALVVGVLLIRPHADDDTSAAGSPTTTSENQRGAVEDPDSVATPDLSDQESRDPDDLLAIGPVDAPVTMIMFTDYQCPYCARWTEDTLPTLRQYVDDGTLRIEFRDVNIYGEDSERAAKAALAAAMQGKHDEYQAALFENGKIRSSSGLSEKSLTKLADDLGLDVEKFTHDLHSKKVQKTIDANAQQGIDLGTMSTPAFIIGGTPMVGAQPTDEFVAAVEKARDEADD